MPHWQYVTAEPPQTPLIFKRSLYVTSHKIHSIKYKLWAWSSIIFSEKTYTRYRTAQCIRSQLTPESFSDTDKRTTRNRNCAKNIPTTDVVNNASYILPSQPTGGCHSSDSAPTQIITHSPKQEVAHYLFPKYVIPKHSFTRIRKYKPPTYHAGSLSPIHNPE